MKDKGKIITTQAPNSFRRCQSQVPSAHPSRHLSNTLELKEKKILFIIASCHMYVYNNCFLK